MTSAIPSDEDHTVVPLPAHRSFETLQVDFADGIIEITLNRPDRLNAISLTMAEEIRTVVREYGFHPDARVVVLRGQGRAFCSGFDVTTQPDDATARGMWLQYRNVDSAIKAFAGAPVVRIAQLHGHVVGGGILISSECELRYGDETTLLGIPHPDSGYPFSLGGVSMLARSIGLTRVAEIVLTGRRLNAQEAFEAGFLTQVVPSERLHDHVMEVARAVAARPASLLLASLTSLDEAARDLLPADTVDLTTLLFVNQDPQVESAKRAYAEKFAKRR